MRNSILTAEVSLLCFLIGATACKGLGPVHYRGFKISLNSTYTLLRMSVQPVAETSTRQNTTLTRNKHLCPWRHSNPQSQQASGGRPMP